VCNFDTNFITTNHAQPQPQLHASRELICSIEINLFSIFRLEKIFVNLGLFGNHGFFVLLFSYLGFAFLRWRVLFARVLIVSFLVNSLVVVLEKSGIVREQGLSRHEAERLASLGSFGLLLLDFCHEFVLLSLRLVSFPLIESLQGYARAVVVLQRSTLLLNLLLEGLLVFIFGDGGTLVLLQDVALGQPVEVLAGVSVVVADPVETVLVLLDSFDEILARDDGILGHLAGLLAGVCVDVNVRLLGVGHGHVVRVLALFALLAHTGLEVGTQGLLEVHSTVVGDSNLSDRLEEGSNECVLLIFLLLGICSCAVRLLNSLDAAL
jgi:hypothetical protein